MSIRLGRLLVSEEALQKILDFLPYPFLVARLKDDVHHVAYVNQKFVDEIGYTHPDIPTIVEWFQLAYPDPDYRKAVADGWYSRNAEAKRLGHDSTSAQVRIHTKYHGDRWYEVKASVSDPQMVAFIDIHAGKSREENLKMLNHNRDRVLSVLGHDLRGPMNQLYSLVRMASKQQISQDEFMKLMADVNDKAVQSMEFLSTTLTWARTNFDFIQIKHEEIEMLPLALEVVQLYETTYSSKNIEVVVLIDPSYGINADKEIIVTVLRNLISNAIKFTDRNGRIEIIGIKDSDSKQVIVKDTGIGMDPSTVSRILSSNYSSSVGTQGEKGLGIGIMLCNDLLKRMGTSLQVESEIGKGTAMKIVIPV